MELQGRACVELGAMARLNCREPLFCHFNPSAVEMEKPTKKEEKNPPNEENSKKWREEYRVR